MTAIIPIIKLYLAVRVALVIVVLAAMIFVLLGINHFLLAERRDDAQDAKRLREEVEKSRFVISSHSIFHKFLARPVSPRRRAERERLN